MPWADLPEPWRVCLEQAWTAYQAGSLPIGAVVVDRAGQIVGRGRNRIFEAVAESPETRCLFGHRLAHAEVNALIEVDYATVNIKECTLYTTLEPCALCVGAIRMVALKDVRYAASDPAAGSLSLLEATEFMRRGRVQAQHLEQPDLEAVLIAMNTEALLSISQRFELQLPLGWWSMGVPAVDFGRELFASGRLRRLASDPGCTIQHVLLALAGEFLRWSAKPSTSASFPEASRQRTDSLGQVGKPPMVLIITGAPASGKSTMGRQLAQALGLPYLAKDLFKETLFDSLGWEDRAWSRRLAGASMALLFRTAAALLEAGQSVALESNFYREWDTPQLRVLSEHFGCRFVQVVCTAPGTTLIERFERRIRTGERHPGHADATWLDEVLPRLLVERWEALDLDGPVFSVDTANGPIDVAGLCRRIRAAVAVR
jgi:tRNA(Arg) A34 adenosine deaminase TadA/adenylylsulfate kinase-like enzyme